MGNLLLNSSDISAERNSPQKSELQNQVTTINTLVSNLENFLTTSPSALQGTPWDSFRNIIQNKIAECQSFIKDSINLIEILEQNYNTLDNYMAEGAQFGSIADTSKIPALYEEATQLQNRLSAILNDPEHAGQYDTNGIRNRIEQINEELEWLSKLPSKESETAGTISYMNSPR